MIGDILRKERERQKLTVQDVEQGTSIRSVYIEALENGDYDKLPGEVYAKGFVKNYAGFLNLDAETLSKEFSAELSPPVVEVAEGETVIEENIVEDTPKKTKTKITELKSTDIAVNNSGNSSGSNFSIIAAVVLIALLAGGAWFYMQNSVEVADKNPPQQTEVQPPVENPPPTNQVSAAVPQDGVNIHATFAGDCWTRVIVDGAYAYEGVPNAGQTFDWHGAESITIRAGNAGAIDIVMNGQSIGTLGEYGEVLERTFTRNLP